VRRPAILCTVVALLAHTDVWAQSSAAQAQQRPATPTWQEAYDNGVRAIGAKNWKAAIAALQTAKRFGPKPAGRVAFTSSRVDAFVPDYYLGVAFLNDGQFANAVAAFESVSPAELGIERDRRFRDWRDLASTAKFEAGFNRAQEAVKKGDSVIAQRELSSVQTLAGERNNARVTDLQGEIARLTTPRPPPVQDDLVVVPDLTGSLSQSAEGLLRQLGLQVGKIEQRESDVRADSILSQQPAAGTRVRRGTIIDIFVAAPKLIAGPPPTKPTTGESTGPGPTAPGPSPPGPSPPRGSRGGRGTVPPGPPVSGLDERGAIAAFYSGRYDAAAQALTAIVSASTPARVAAPSPRSRFYLACSLAALVIVGDRDKSEIASAQRHLKDAGDLKQFASDLRYVSPRILTVLGVGP
jgi:hypothetical protein